MRNGISAVLIVKNEEKVLGRCLKSLEEADEICVLDTGSTDRTMEVARGLTSVVVATPPIEPFHFAEARNRADRLASQDWILTIDADEVLAEGSMREIRRAVRRYGHAAGFRMDFFFAGRDGENRTSLKKMKVYRNGFWKWGFRVHEQLFPMKGGKIFDLPPSVSMTHLPNDEKELRRRQNLELLKLSVEEDPSYLRNWRQLGMESFIMGEYADAAPHLVRYLDGKDIDPLDRSETRVHLARCRVHLGDLGEALLEFERAIGESPNRREPYVYKALALVNAARLDEALIEIKRCLSIPEDLKPNFHLNVEAIWNGSFPKEISDFCESQIAEAKKRWYAGERGA